VLSELKFSPRSWLSLLAWAAASICLATPAAAQDFDLADLKLRVDTLERNDDQRKVEIVGLQVSLAAAEKDIAQLKLDLAKVKADAAKLAADVAALKKSKPGDGQALTLRAPFIVQDGSGRTVFQVDVPAGRGLPRVLIGNPSAARVEMGPGTGGSSAVGLFDDANKLLVALAGDPRGSYLRLRDDEQTANLGKIEGVGQGLFLRKGDKDIAELSADKAGAGNLRIFGAGGKAVAGLFSDSDGARMALTAAAGGPSAISFAVTPSGGKIRVFAANGGKARAELTAEGPLGALNIFDVEGTTAATLATAASKAGFLQISNGRGAIVVEAGADSKTGRGRVSAGPYDAGVAGTMGGGMQAASSIVGSNTAK
jgi:hypothetical protein